MGHEDDLLISSMLLKCFDEIGIGEWAQKAAKNKSPSEDLKRTVLIIMVMDYGAKNNELHFTQVLGQVVFKFRGAEPIRFDEKLKKEADCIAWLRDDFDSHAELLRSFYYWLTVKDGEKLGWKHWLRTVQMLRASPKISESVSAHDVSNVFIVEARIHGQHNVCESDFDLSKHAFTLDFNSFVRCLVKLAEQISTHPCRVFAALSGHDEVLRQVVLRQEHVKNQGASAGSKSLPRRPSVEVKA